MLENNFQPKKNNISIITRLRAPSNNNKNITSPFLENSQYTMFTSSKPSNKLFISKQPINSKILNETLIKTPQNNYMNIFPNLSSFTFNKVYNEKHSLDLIYKEEIKNNINDLFYKKNCCVFFFGPESSGKSYVLRGGDAQNEKEPGILTRVINDILNVISINKFFIIKCSVYQIFMDNIYDLLSNDINQLNIKEDLNNSNGDFCNTYVEGLIKKNINNKQEYDLIIREAINNRKNLNQVLGINNNKKRSHLIITIYLTENNYTLSQINFVELASSNFGILNDNDDYNYIANENNNNLFKNTSNVFNSIAENIISLAKGCISNNDSILTLALKKTMSPTSNIIFMNCVVPWEFPLSDSFTAVKFSNMIYCKCYENNQNDIFNLIDNNDKNKIKEFLNNLTQNENQIPEKITPPKNIQNMQKNNINNKKNTNKNKIDSTRKQIINDKLKFKKNNNMKNYNNNNLKINKNEKLSEQDLRLKQLDESLKEIEAKNSELNQKINNDIPINDNSKYYKDLYLENNNISNNIDINNRSDFFNQKSYFDLVQSVKSVNFNDENEFDKMKQNQTTLKTDNIILKEDINHLTEINTKLENELKEQRNRNLQLMNENEDLNQKLISMENLLDEYKSLNEQSKINEASLEKSYNDRLALQTQVCDIENNLKKITEEKSNLEVNYNVLLKQYEELKQNYDLIYNEYNNMKEVHEDELGKIEEKIDFLVKEVEKLQNENSILIKENEQQRLEKNAIILQKDNFKEKFEDQKSKNDILSGKILEIEEEFKKLQNEKLNEAQTNKNKEENKKAKNVAKIKIVNELQAKIQNYKEQRLRNDKE